MKRYHMFTGLAGALTALFTSTVQARFLSVDPVTTNASNGQSFNRYGYANNSPYKFVDPDGRASVVVNGQIYIRPEDKSVPSFGPFLNSVGAVGVSPSNSFFHTYSVSTPSSITNAAAVGAGIANSPTPGPGNSPATANGTLNNAGPIPMNGPTNMVNSFSVPSPDPTKFTNITVNYTISGKHGLNEGFVVRYGEIGSNGAITLRSYGEGNNWQQSSALKDFWGPIVDRTWTGNHRQIINGASR